LNQTPARQDIGIKPRCAPICRKQLPSAVNFYLLKRKSGESQKAIA